MNREERWTRVGAVCRGLLQEVLPLPPGRRLEELDAPADPLLEALHGWAEGVPGATREKVLDAVEEWRREAREILNPGGAR